MGSLGNKTISVPLSLYVSSSFGALVSEITVYISHSGGYDTAFYSGILYP